MVNMESADASNAAIEIDILISKNPIISYYALHFSGNYALRLSEKLFDLTGKGFDRSYPELISNIDIFKEPIENYFGENFTGEFKISDLADKIVKVSKDLGNILTYDQNQQVKLWDFCLDLSEKLSEYGGIGWQKRSVA